MKYAIIKNAYFDSQQIEQELLTLFANHPEFSQDLINPEYVFVIGGDGTFLEAVRQFASCLDKIIFVPIKLGGIGFYTNHNTIAELKEVIPFLTNDEHFDFVKYALLEVNYDNKVAYAINEIKITNNIKPLNLEICINDEKLESFKGTGLVFSTPSGSTGFMKSAGGAIIYPNAGLYEMQELFAVSTNKFRTLNAPIIFSEQQKIKLKISDLIGVYLSADTHDIAFSQDEIFVHLSSLSIKVLTTKKEKPSKTKILNDIFVLNDKTKN